MRQLEKLPPPFDAHLFGWDRLGEIAVTAAPATVIVIEPLDGDGRIDGRVRELMAATPTLPIVAVVPLEPEYTGIVRELLAMGIAEIADAGFERGPEAIRPRLLAAHGKPLKNLVEPALSRFVTENALTLIRGAIETVADGGSALHLAALFGSADRTVTGWCHRERLPPPRRLLAWMRVVLALALLREPRRSVLNVALSAGYGTEHALRRVLRQFLGGNAQPRARSLESALTAFNAELRALREARRSRR